MPPQRMRSATTQRSDGDFFCIQKLPEKFRWQDLKDLLRHVLDNEPGWVDVMALSKKQGGHCARFSVKTDTDARKAYEYLTTKMQHLLVHRFDASGSQPVLVQCNCFERLPGTTGHCSKSSPIDNTKVAEYLFLPEATHASIQALHYPVPSMMPVVYAIPPIYQGAQMAPSLPASPQTQAYSRIGSAYSYSVTPGGYQIINPNSQAVRNGLTIQQYPSAARVMEHGVLTEARGVFVSDLDFDTTRQILEKHIRQIADPISVDMPMDARKHGKCKGHAVVRFRSAEDADMVIKQLSGSTLLNRKIKLRHDKERVVIETRNPCIVNGSQVY